MPRPSYLTPGAKAGEPSPEEEKEGEGRGGDELV